MSNETYDKHKLPHNQEPFGKKKKKRRSAADSFSLEVWQDQHHLGPLEAKKRVLKELEAKYVPRQIDQWETNVGRSVGEPPLALFGKESGTRRT